MPDPNERDAKLLQYLSEAYGKEQELETALTAHINLTDRDAYKKRLKQHLKETKGHSKQVARRIKALGGQPPLGQTVVGKATATLKGPVHALRGSGLEEKLLKNAKTEYSEEAEEIATYTAIEAFAEAVGDRETAKVARSIRREEERMAAYLEKLIPQLAKAVSRAEVPSDQRTKPRRSSSSKTKRASTSAKPKPKRASAAAKRKSTSTRSRATKSSSSRSRSTRSRSGSRS